MPGFLLTSSPPSIFVSYILTMAISRPKFNYGEKSSDPTKNGQASRDALKKNLIRMYLLHLPPFFLVRARRATERREREHAREGGKIL